MKEGFKIAKIKPLNKSNKSQCKIYSRKKKTSVIKVILRNIS